MRTYRTTPRTNDRSKELERDVGFRVTTSARTGPRQDPTATEGEGSSALDVGPEGRPEKEEAVLCEEDASGPGCMGVGLDDLCGVELGAVGVPSPR